VLHDIADNKEPTVIIIIIDKGIFNLLTYFR